MPFARLGDIPDEPGVYIVIRTDPQIPIFNASSTAKPRKGRLGAVSIDLLKDQWVENCAVVYIGKAGGPNNASTLKSRLELYRATGAGTSTKHQGGRYIWQLSDSDQLLVCWKVVLEEEPVAVEKQMFQQFREDHGGVLPFANLRE